MMKHKGFLTGIFGVLLVFGLILAGCGGGDGGGGGGGGDPALKGTVSISGTEAVDGTLTANTDNLQGTGTISYEWKRSAAEADAEAGNGTAIGGNSTSYALVTADEGKYIAVTVKRVGYSGSITSAASAKVAASGIPALTGTVSITGTAKVDETLIADITSLGGSGTISYVWKRVDTAADVAAGKGTPIGETSDTDTTYKLVPEDKGKYITVTVTRADNSGKITSATEKVAPVDAIDLTGTVTITGNAIVGQTLTADTTSLNGSGAFSYVWKWSTTATGAGIPIYGATTATYKLLANDENRYITVTVTRDDNSGSITSTATAKVLMAKSLKVTGITGAFNGKNFTLGLASTTADLLAETPVAYAEGRLSGSSQTVALLSFADHEPWTDSGSYYVGVIINGDTYITRNKELFSAAVTPVAMADFEPEDSDFWPAKNFSDTLNGLYPDSTEVQAAEGMYGVGLLKDLTLTSNLDVPAGVILAVSENKKLTVGAGTTLNLDDGYGSLVLMDNATLTVNGTVNAKSTADETSFGIVMLPLFGTPAATINGSGIIHLKTQGYLLVIMPGQKLTLSGDVMLDGLTTETTYPGTTVPYPARIGGDAINNTINLVLVNGGELDMQGGTITGNYNTADSDDDSDQNGGGVQVIKPRDNTGIATFTMSGNAKVSGNKTVGGAGGVTVYMGGTFIMNDGEISGKSSDHAGGGVSVHSYDLNSTFTMNGGTVYGSSEPDSIANRGTGGGFASLYNGGGATTQYGDRSPIPLDEWGHGTSQTLSGHM